MRKFVKRIGTDKIKFNVNFSALTANLTSDEPNNILLQVARGDQKAVSFPILRVDASNGV